MLAEADDVPPPSNLAKMSAGQPLDDRDREPWLRDIAAWIAARAGDGRPAVVTCSALKRSYRDLPRAASPRLAFLHLTGAPELIAARMRARSDHFMPVSLLDSQLATLEPLGPDERGRTLDVGSAPEELAASAEAGLTGLRAGG